MQGVGVGRHAEPGPLLVGEVENSVGLPVHRGVQTLVEGEMYEMGAEMAERYGGADGLAYLEGTKDEPRYLIKLTPEKITSWRGPWHPRYGSDPREE